MFPQLLSLALFTTTVLSTDVYRVDDFNAMLKRGAEIQKRQGYYPTTHYCGSGQTCQEACGPTYEQCPSNSGIYCFDPTIGSHCCTDGTGNSCDKGYYCTTDGASNTYCCPDGTDTVSCAAAYSLTVALIAESSTAAPIPSAASTNIPVYTPVTTTPIHVVIPTATGTVVHPSANGTVTTAAPPPAFTGGAAKVGGGVLAVMAGAAGLARFL